VARSLETSAGASSEDDGDHVHRRVPVSRHPSILAAYSMKDGLRKGDRRG
jgi:hypothetical protein